MWPFMAFLSPQQPKDEAKQKGALALNTVEKSSDYPRMYKQENKSHL